MTLTHTASYSSEIASDADGDWAWPDLLTMTAGRAYLACVTQFAVAAVGAPPTLTDNLGNTWTHYTYLSRGTGQLGLITIRNAYLYRCVATAGGTATLTTNTNASATSNCFIGVAEFTGFQTDGSLFRVNVFPQLANDGTFTGLQAGTTPWTDDGQPRYLDTAADSNSIRCAFSVVGATGTITPSTGWTERAAEFESAGKFSFATAAASVLVFEPTWVDDIHSIHMLVEVVDAAAPSQPTCDPEPVSPDNFGASANPVHYSRTLITTGTDPFTLPAANGADAVTLQTGHLYLLAAMSLRANDPRSPDELTLSGWTFTELGAADTRDYNTIASPDNRLNLYVVHGGTGGAGLTITVGWPVAMSPHNVELFYLGEAGVTINTTVGTQGVLQTKGAVADAGANASATFDSAMTAGSTFLAAGAATTASPLMRPIPPTGARLLNRQRDHSASSLTNLFVATRRSAVSGAQSFTWAQSIDNAIRIIELAGVAAAGSSALAVAGRSRGAARSARDIR